MAYDDTDKRLREPREIRTTRSSGSVVLGLGIAIVVILAVVIGASMLGGSSDSDGGQADTAPMIESEGTVTPNTLAPPEGSAAGEEQPAPAE